MSRDALTLAPKPSLGVTAGGVPLGWAGVPGETGLTGTPGVDPGAPGEVPGATGPAGVVGTTTGVVVLTKIGVGTTTGVVGWVTGVVELT